MKLSTRSRYGARILLELARHYNQGPLQVSELARLQSIPVKYLEQLIRTLKQADLVSSVRGPKGGHMIMKAPEEVTLGEVVRIFEGQSDLVECISSPEKCGMSEACRVRQAWKKATQVLYENLDTVTIADLALDNGVLIKGCGPKA